MNRIFLVTTLSLTALLGGCAATGDQSTNSALLLDGREHDHFGLGAHEGDTVDLATLLADPEEFDGQRVRVVGSVGAVCKAAGCWARMSDGDHELFIKMKDHAFFLPLDCEGREAVMEGVVKIEETSVAELKHYAEDAGSSQAEIDAITEPKREVVLTAAGVALAK